MIYVLIGIIIAYLLVGFELFSVGLKRIGGKKAYIKYLSEDRGFKYPRFIFYSGAFVFLFIWPSAIHKGGNEDE